MMANIKINVSLNFSAFVEWSPKLGRYMGTMPALHLRVDGSSISNTRKVLRDVAHRYIALLRRAYERERRRKRTEKAGGVTR